MSQWKKSLHAGKITAMDTGSAKQKLRNEINLQRPQSSAGLLEQLRGLAQSTQARKIASYSPLVNEPDLRAFNDWVEESFDLYYPRIIGDHLEFAQGPLAAGNFKTLEPTGPAIDPVDIDLVLVPALAVDLLGNRLGKGRGFYDRWLEVAGGLKVYAVVFDSEILNLVPHENHDKKVNGIVTPTRVIAI